MTNTLQDTAPSVAAGETAPRDGVVLVATGPAHYLHLAELCARSLRKTNPGLAVDLYTDEARDTDLFDRVVILDEPWHRSKIDALLTSRFARTLYLDSDIVVVADISDVFEILDRFDVAAVHDPVRASHYGLYWKRPLPNAFPTMNGGVLAVKRSDATRAFLEDWKAAVKGYELKIDQPPLRELLYDSDLRIATLPEEYNLLWPQAVRHWRPGVYSAPRVVHSPLFHRHFHIYGKVADPVAERYGRIAYKLKLLLASDRELAAKEGRSPRAPAPRDRMRELVWMAGYRPRRAVQLFGRRLRRMFR